MTANILEIDGEWVYLQIEHQIKFRARYSLKEGKNIPVPGSSVKINFIRPEPKKESFNSGLVNKMIPHVELSQS